MDRTGKILVVIAFVCVVIIGVGMWRQKKEDKETKLLTENQLK